MTASWLKLFAATGMALGLVLASPAFAQDTAPRADPAAEGAEENEGTILVIARRFEERLQDVPISMIAFNQEQLTDRNIASSVDLAAYNPSLAVNSRYGPDKASFAIRGFS